MQILNDFELARSSYIIGLETGEVSNETRTLISEEVTKYLSLFNNIIDLILTFVYKQIDDKKITIEDAVAFFEDEYKAFKLDELYFPVDCYSSILKLILIKLNGDINANVKFDLIKKIYETKEAIKVEELKNGVLLFVGKAIFTFDMASVDTAFLLEVSKSIKDLSKEQIEAAVIPENFLAELWVS